MQSKEDDITAIFDTSKNKRYMSKHQNDQIHHSTSLKKIGRFQNDGFDLKGGLTFRNAWRALGQNEKQQSRYNYQHWAKSLKFHNKLSARKVSEKNKYYVKFLRISAALTD